MPGRHHVMLILVALVLLMIKDVQADKHSEAGNELGLSSEVRGLLQAEMREVATASQALPLSIASGDWRSVMITGEKIHASYVMAQALSAEQKQELKEKLPADFKRLDSEFHARAKKLSEAAKSHDSEAVVFQYYRMLESCTVCHATYAKSRFPGFNTQSQKVHKH